MAPNLDYNSFYKEQTVFLTGGTGGLGTCVLYKLCVELPTKKVYVLVRSVDKALRMWQDIIPNQVDAISNSGKIVLVTGNMCHDNLGIAKDVLSDIQSETTIFINTAANTSWSSTLTQAITDNCTTALTAAALATSFPLLKLFIQISSAYCTAFLPDGPVPETLHPIYDPEHELQTIRTTGTSPHASRFPWHYAHSKHLAEELLVSRFGDKGLGLPLLIMRPASIGSAVRSPFCGYGPTKSIPGEMFWRVHTFNPGTNIFHTALGSESGTNIFDETPVDWISNLILLHASKGTQGVVHTTAGTFIPQTLDDNIALYFAEGDREVKWEKDRKVRQAPTVEFYRVVSGDWRFETGRSGWCKGVEGVLSVDVQGVDAGVYNGVRRGKVRGDIERAVERRRGRVGREKAMMHDTLTGREGRARTSKL